MFNTTPELYTGLKGHTLMSIALPQGADIIREPRKPRPLTESDMHTPITARMIILTLLHYTPLGCGHGADLIHTGCEDAWWGSPACCRHFTEGSVRHLWLVFTCQLHLYSLQTYDLTTVGIFSFIMQHKYVFLRSLFCRAVCNPSSCTAL